jgi:hypothetical protein
MSDMSSLKDLIGRSSISFVGSVQSLGQSPEPGVEADERTALVRVERTLHAPDQVDLGPGLPVVVQLDANLPPLEPGDRATFFAEPLIYGSTLVVSEVARTEAEALPQRAPGPADAQGVTPTSVALGELRDEAALDHARGADAVVRATVVGLRAAASNPTSEHDPHWWIATLDVDVVAQGELPGVGEENGAVDVLYANSLDRPWRTSPKPKAGQSGMWILHRTEGELEQFAPFQLIHPEDLQPSLLIDALIGEATDDTEDDES